MTRTLGAVAAACLLVLAPGCKKKGEGTQAPETRTVAAAPAPEQPVVIQSSRYVEAPPEDNPEVIGYDTLSDGTEVTVVTYVHTYPDPIDTYPRVYWAGTWYYNVNGDFVYWSDYYGRWCYYYGPPRPLIVVWNWYYPWAPFYWGVGYYGAGFYWGGVSVYGYHAYGLPVWHHHHHHYGHYHRGTRHAHQGTPGGTGRRPSTGGPSGPGKPPQTGTQAGRPPGAPSSGAQAAGNKLADPRGPEPASAGNKVAARPGGQPNVSRYTTPSGQQVTTVSPPSARPAQATALPTVQSRGRGYAAQPAQPSYRPNVAPATSDYTGASGPRPAQGSAAPTRGSSAPSRGYAQPSPGSTPNRGYTQPARSSTPSRGYTQPSRPSSPPRQSSPSRYTAPSRSSSPSRGYSAPRPSSPSRSAPRRATPSRSAPRSAPRSSSPSSRGGGRRPR